MAQVDPWLSRLKKAALVCTIIVMCLLCAVISMLLAMLMDVRREVKTLRGQTAQAMTNLAHLEASVARSLDFDFLDPVLERGVEQLPLPRPGVSGGNPTAQQEIAYLLSCIGRPELQYEYEGKHRTASWVQMKLNGKAVILDNEIASAENFIDKVGTRTHEGGIYYLIDKEGKKVELKTWLHERLQERRASATTENH